MAELRSFVKTIMFLMTWTYLLASKSLGSANFLAKEAVLSRYFSTEMF